MKNKFVIKNDTTITNVLKIYNKYAIHSLVVVDNQDKLIGTLTEGDVRRSLLKGRKLNERINGIYNTNHKFLYSNTFKVNSIKKIFIKYDINIIPVVDQFKKIKKVYYNNKINLKKKISYLKKNLAAVIMVGGQGKRLKPFTNILPKSLIPIGGKPIIGFILDKLLKYKIKKVYFTINASSQILKTFLNEQKIKTKLNFIVEKKKLGTIGGISKIRFGNIKNVLVTNCDTFININLDEFYKFHNNFNNDLTLVVSKYNFKIPYGICKLSKSKEFEKLLEKPNFSFLINSGMYILNKKIIKLIPKNTEMNINDLIIKVKDNNYKIGLYPIKKSSVFDTGEWDKFFQSSNKLIKKIY
jgi:dTDP-glucose pyrophosphorylase